eukprot:Rmarinus@m.22244
MRDKKASVASFESSVPPTLQAQRFPTLRPQAPSERVAGTWRLSRRRGGGTFLRRSLRPQDIRAEFQRIWQRLEANIAANPLHCLASTCTPTIIRLRAAVEARAAACGRCSGGPTNT